MKNKIYYCEGNKEFVEVQYAAVRPFRNLAKKYRVSITNTNKTLWFHVRRENELLGCCGIYLGNKSVGLKAYGYFHSHAEQECLRLSMIAELMLRECWTIKKLKSSPCILTIMQSEGSI